MATQLKFEPAKVVVVEDEFLVALQIEDLIKGLGHEVVATIADRASLANLQITPDLALVDLNLRDGLTGPQIARELNERYGCKIVYVTANPDDIDVPAASAVGIVQKPFSCRGLTNAIGYAIEGKRGPMPSGMDPIGF